MYNTLSIMNRNSTMILLVLLRMRAKNGRRRLSAKAIAKERRRRHTRNQSAFLDTCSEYERKIRHHRLPRIALLSVSKSPWRQLYESGDDQSLVTAVGFTHESFKYVLDIFEPAFKYNTPFQSDTIRPCDPNAGRPRKVKAEDCLALVLFWSRCKGNGVPLSMIFGMTSSNMCVYLKFGRRIFIEVFRKHPLARIRVPPAEKIEEYKLAVGDRHENIPDVWATMDGLKLEIQAPLDSELQNNFYNGWTHGHYLTSVFVFCPDGTIPVAFFNVPGCLHDSTVADWGKIYEKLERVYNLTGAKTTVDSAFTTVGKPFLIKSSQDEFGNRADTEIDARTQIRINKDATSMRQSAEWGMKELQASNPRLTDTFRWEERGERCLITKQIILGYNLRARLVGINQLQNVYMPHLRRSARSVFE